MSVRQLLKNAAAADDAKHIIGTRPTLPLSKYGGAYENPHGVPSSLNFAGFTLSRASGDGGSTTH
jgi:hypothetical protein